MENPKGLTNKTTLTDSGIFIKESRPDVDYFLDRKAEEKLYEQFELLDHDDEIIIKPLGWQFMKNGDFSSHWEFIPRSFTFQQKPLLAREKDYQLKVIDGIRQYHRIKADMPVFQPLEYLNKFRDKINHHLVDLSEYDDMLDAVIKKHFDLSKDKLVLSHNDMVPGNFLFINDGKDLKLIDYEYSCLNNFLFDYAGFITETLPQDQEEEFIQMLGFPEKETKELRYLIFYCYILWINWANYMYEQRGDEVYKNLALEIYDRLINDEKLKDLEI